MGERNGTILHVDDDEANRYAVTRSLVKAGFDVTEGVDGASALRLAADRPDLIILDVRLPDMDGFEVCRRIKHDPATADIPVLHLSASYTTSEAKAYGLDGGAEAYLIRPVEPVELVATVRALLRAKRTEEALRASEGRLRMALGAARMVAWEFVPATDRLTLSENAADVFGLPPVPRIESGRGWSALVHPEDVDRHRATIARAVADCGSYVTQYRVVRGDTGAAQWMEERAHAVPDAAGRTARLVGVVSDVTDRRRAEEARERQHEAERQARVEAERAGQMKDEFLATLGHELRTPLNAILGWSQILSHGTPGGTPGGTPESADLAEGLATIERNARAQSQIIEDLLDMSRIVSGKIRLDVRPLDLSAVVDAAVATVRPAADAKGVQLVSVVDSLPGDVVSGTVVSGDGGRLQQVFWNLLSNAVKFTPKGGRVRVVLRRAGSSLEAAVVDTGEGVAPEFLPFVFDRFRQADASTTRRHGGLGLGLSIVKQLVELHGGSVRIASAGPGQGTAVVVALPVTAVRPEADPPVGRPRPSPQLTDVATGITADVAGVRVLVVDDEPDARRLVKRLLDDRKAVVTTTGDVDEAVRLVRTRQFDVLVSDIGMPGEDGHVLIRRVRALGADAGGSIPAIALTAYARAEDRVKALTAGFQRYLAKPVDEAELVALVAGAAGRTGHG